jgi:hypothetical protein
LERTYRRDYDFNQQYAIDMRYTFRELVLKLAGLSQGFTYALDVVMRHVSFF